MDTAEELARKCGHSDVKKSGVSYRAFLSMRKPLTISCYRVLFVGKLEREIVEALAEATEAAKVAKDRGESVESPKTWQIVIGGPVSKILELKIAVVESPPEGHVDLLFPGDPQSSKASLVAAEKWAAHQRLLEELAKLFRLKS